MLHQGWHISDMGEIFYGTQKTFMYPYIFIQQ